jgi:D-alanyl-D-alanine carboxypeptidase
MGYGDMSRRSAVASILCGISAGKRANADSTSVGVPAQNDLPHDVQSFLDGFAPGKIVGLTLAVDSGSDSWAGKAGYARLQTKTPIRVDDATGIGSITKTFVAVVAMQLHEAGKLALDATAAKYLGRQRLKSVANAGEASIAQLMAHTSGIPSAEDDPAWIRAARGAGIEPAKIWKPTESLEYIYGRKALSAPGAAYNYSNSNYTILGLVIEEISGNRLWHEIAQRICSPLDLSHTYMDGISKPLKTTKCASRYHYETPHFDRVAGVSRYFSQVGGGLIDVSESNLSCEWGDGNMISTAPDVAAFFSALHSGRLVKPASLDFMTAWRRAGPLGGGQYFYTGHGLFRQASGEHAIVGHTGGVLGSTANAFWIEGTPITFAALSNVGVEDIGEPKTSVNSVGQNPEFIAMLSSLAGKSR